MLTRLADLAIGFGCNLQEGQIVAISGEPGKERLIRALAESAYKRGAKFVDVGWFDPYVKRARIQYAAEDTLDFVPPWIGGRVLELGELHAARVALSGPVAPGLLEDLDPVRAGRDRLPSVKEAGKVVNDRTTNWTIVPCTTVEWAELVHPDLSGEDALAKLDEQIVHVLRLDEDDPIAAWKQRADTLVSAAATLTGRGFDALHYEGPGTDLTIGLLPRREVGGGPLRDRRRRRAHAEPADGGGLHLARPAARGGARDLHQAARADRRHRRAQPARALRGRPRRPGRRRLRPGRHAHDRRPRRGRRPPRRGRARRRRGPHRQARHRLLRHAARRERGQPHRARPGLPVPRGRLGVRGQRERDPHRLHDRLRGAEDHGHHAPTASGCPCCTGAPGRSSQTRVTLSAAPPWRGAGAAERARLEIV